MPVRSRFGGIVIPVPVTGAPFTDSVVGGLAKDGAREEQDNAASEDGNGQGGVHCKRGEDGTGTPQVADEGQKRENAHPEAADDTRGEDCQERIYEKNAPVASEEAGKPAAAGNGAHLPAVLLMS